VRTDFEALLQFNGHKQSTWAVDVVAPSSLPADKCEPNGAHDSPEVGLWEFGLAISLFGSFGLAAAVIKA